MSDRWQRCLYGCLFLAIAAACVLLSHDLYCIWRAAMLVPDSEPSPPLDPQRRAEWLRKSVENCGKALLFRPQDPEIWQRQGRYLLMLAELAGDPAGELETKALHSLQRAIASMPRNATCHFDCGVIYQRRHQYTHADSMMIRAQLLIPGDITLARPLADYWFERYRQTCGRAYLWPLMDRLYLLNRTDFATHGDYTLTLWKQAAPDQEVWRKIVPPTPAFAIQAARLLLRRKDFPALERMLSHLGDDLARKFLLQGHGQLAQGNTAAALAAYKKMALATGVTQADFHEAAVALASAGECSQAIAFLRTHRHATGDGLMAVLEAASAAGSDMLPLLEQTAQEFHELPLRFYFLLSKAHAGKKKWSKAVEYAQQVMEKRPAAEYVDHFFALLLSLQMAEKVELALHRHHFRLPGSDIWCHRLARHYLARRQADKAMSWARQALSLAPDNAAHTSLLDEICRYLAQQSGTNK